MEALRLEKAKFLLSVPSVELLPAGDMTEIAFFGRSNVGKSSLLNFLAGQKSLARVSKTPGRTRALNLFEAELEKKKIWFLDLPGHGYAKLSLTERDTLSDLLSDYIEKREQLNVMIHLLDCRRDPKEEDIEISRQFREHVPYYLVVMTKIDQLPLSKRKDMQKRFARILEISSDQCFAVSSNEHLGREELLMRISRIASQPIVR
ncbi:MAG: ribosome biogenesis GTP-binding protein YihA/YsxC [Myxococcota bacterium]